MNTEVVELVVTNGEAGRRLDRILSDRLPEWSRSILQRWIAEERVRVDGAAARASTRPRAGAVVTLRPEASVTPTTEPQDIPLDILFEDALLVVVNKPAGLVVHPSPGHPDRTLVNALRFHTSLSEDGDPGRPGIVHRLDKDTSGVMVAAKSAAARENLVAQFKKHSIEREYLAIVKGAPPVTAVYDTMYGRHPVKRKRFTSRVARGKRAVTRVRLLESFGAAALVACRLQTGRTHQVRVHLSENGYPLLADKIYGRAARDRRLREATARIGRQALHAALLGFDHPATGERIRFEAPLPEEFERALAALRE
jgi:23S rRNA pseudouridine1911/1915/1917 synthase